MNPTQRTSMIVAVLALVLGWALVSGLALPRWVQFNELREQEALARTKIAKLERLAARKPLIEQAYASYASFRSDEPDALTQRSFLDELEQLAAAGNVQLNLKPRPIQEDARVSRVVVEMDVDGTQEELLSFLDRLLAWPRLIEIERLRIAPSPSKDNPLRASLVVNKLVIRTPPTKGKARAAASSKGG